VGTERSHVNITNTIQPAATVGTERSHVNITNTIQPAATVAHKHSLMARVSIGNIFVTYCGLDMTNCDNSSCKINLHHIYVNQNYVLIDVVYDATKLCSN